MNIQNTNQNIKIELEPWKKVMVEAITQIGIKPSKAEKIFEVIVDIKNTHLICNMCRNVLPDVSFYFQKTQTARRCRHHSCIDCIKSTYRGKKG